MADALMAAPEVTFWGVRGSIPTPGPGTARYGGNTPCVSVSNGDGNLVVLDAGSGIRNLGDRLMHRPRASALEVELLLSHTHWDHIQGLPFFKPLSDPRTCVRIHGARQDESSLSAILERQMEPSVFPVPLTALAARIEVHEIGPGPFEIPGFRAEAIRLRHPGTTLGFILEPAGGGRRFAYLTDNELDLRASYPLPDTWRADLIERLRGVDTLIHDAMYADAFVEARAGWGHSTPAQSVELARNAGVRRVILFHHEPENDDAAIDALLKGAREAARRDGSLIVDAAVEGDSFAL
ncbi:MAG TPA: MBL fold metallo-hydrolase [Gemmatimonadales bacterium]|nr:MBL fold metallo-hydrolase [Gemmatimonadales bacterium]